MSVSVCLFVSVSVSVSVSESVSVSVCVCLSVSVFYSQIQVVYINNLTTFGSALAAVRDAKQVLLRSSRRMLPYADVC